MRRRSLAVAAVAAFVLIPVTGVPSLAATTTAPATAQGYQDRVLTLTNKERTRRGLRPLALSTCADGFADPWARTLAGRHALAHQQLRPILSACKARRVGENVAHGNRTADQMVQMWLASPGHRANLLNPAFTHLGVGAVVTGTGRWFGVQVFLTR